MQVMIAILAGYHIGMFMVVKESHRGAMWNNCFRLGVTSTAATLALFHRSFAVIAFGQFAAVFLITIAIITDLRKGMKGLPMGLRGANWTTAKATLKPSGMFGMVFMQTFLLFQVPVIIMQRLLGPEIVVLFAISRTILGTARQMLTAITTAIAPEITFSFGSGDLKKLLEIFHYSERVVFSLIPVANLGAYLLSPLLLAVWLHRPDLFEQTTYILMTLVSVVMSIREHKVFFQYSTNTHRVLAHIIFWGNLAMIAVSIPLTIHFGLHGFLYTWLASEIVLMTLIYRENRKLFADDPTITLVPVLKLAALVGLSLPPCALLVSYARHHSLIIVGVSAVGACAVLAVASYYVFGLETVRARIWFRVS